MAAVDILRAFDTRPPEFDFVLPGMLAGSVGLLVSPGGAGKSMAALEMGCAIASGTPDGDLLGLEPKQGKVFYLAGEDPELAIWHRLHAMGERFTPATREAIASDLTVLSIVGHQPNIMDPRWHDWIIQSATGHRLIIIDTLTRFHQLDENSNGEMSQLISMLEYIAKQTGCAILVLHHSSKSMAVAGRGDEQQSGRGASALIDNARWCGNLMGMTKDEAKQWAEAPGGPAIKDEGRGFYVRFAISKQNHGMPFGEKWYVRAKGGALVPASIYPFKRGDRSNDV